MDNLYQFDQEYRDTIATVDEKGKRIWVYPKKPSGHFHTRRVIVAILLLALLFGLPFIKLNGDPLLLFDVFERRFIIFGIHLWPQDFHIVALSMISLVVFIVLFTVVFGRVWCGWACSQTIFMEMLFRKIENCIMLETRMTTRKSPTRTLSIFVANMEITRHMELPIATI